MAEEKKIGRCATEEVRFSLDGNADAVEFCSPPFSFLLAAATYTLHERKGKEEERYSTEKDGGAGGEEGTEKDEEEAASSYRVGSLSLFTISDDNEKLQLIHRLPTSAIFDIKWRPHSSDEAEDQDTPPFLAQASSDGTISLYTLQMQHGSHMLKEIATRLVNDSMCLSVDWDPHSRKNLAVSHSDGTLSIIELKDSCIELCETSDNAHGFEAWTIAYDGWKPNIIYSGADDCHFCCWDLRQGFYHPPVFRDKKTHQMGVCSIQTSPHEENILVTGSYDEHIRVWDMRMLEHPLVDKSLELGGGVWKLKWNPFDKHYIAAACMHNGFAIVKIDESNVETVVEYKNHGSLAYGIDWFKAPPWSLVSKEDHRGKVNGLINNSTSLNEPLLASCSFYDRSLHIWRPNLY